MRKLSYRWLIIACMAVTCVPADCAQVPKRTGVSNPALSGVVSSQAEGVMEGVLVSATRAGSPITITVVSDSNGRYAFPAGKLGPGVYKLEIRATGYILSPRSVTVAAIGGAHADLKLDKTNDIAGQLTSAEWMMSVSGTEEQKGALNGCLSCHSLKPVVESNYDADGMVKVIHEMRNESPASNLWFSSKLPYFMARRPGDLKLAEYLSSINLSGGRNHWNFDLKSLPRPKGKSTRVLITEYALPRAGTMPSFAAMDGDGNIWYADFLAAVIGRVNPRTGQAREWPLPLVKPGFEPGSLCMKVDDKGVVWIARSFQGAVARFDPKTEKVTTWSEPREHRNIHSRVSYLSPTPQGKLWFSDTFNRTMNLLDPATGQISAYPAFPGWTWSWDSDVGSGGHGKSVGHFAYSVAADSRGWGYYTDEAGNNLGEIDPEGHVTLFQVPTANAGPRLMHMDAQDRIWFGEDRAAKIGMFDVKTREFKEWADPFPLNDDYDAVPDKAGYVWTGGMTTDLVTRLDPRTGEMTQYLLPRVDVNIRALAVDNLTSPPSLLFGENHQSRIAIVTPLD